MPGFFMARGARSSRAERTPKRPSTAGSKLGIVRFRMASRREAVAPTVDRVIDAVKAAGLSRDQHESLAVAVTEALSNAAVHGNRLHSDKQVRIAVAVSPGLGAIVEVSDSGQGFDTTKLADPTDPARILEPGGRGVFLMRRLVDQLEYNTAGNRVRLTMRRRRR